jgi:hypothetical protein
VPEEVEVKAYLRCSGGAVLGVLAVFALAADGRADLFGDIFDTVKKVAEVAVNPVGAVAKEVAPEPLKKAAEVVTNPVGAAAAAAAPPVASAVKVDPNLVKAIIDPVGTAKQAASAQIVAITRAEVDAIRAQVAAAEAILHGDKDALGRAAVGWAASQVGKALNDGTAQALMPILSPIVPEPLRALAMADPNVEEIYPERAGPIVYYVNGMSTSHKVAVDEAKALSDRLNRKVGLIYNPTEGDVKDALECVYDRSWPHLISPAAKLIQANNTTRKVTRLLYNEAGKVSIVSHSQGVLIVRNALMTADAFRGGKLRSRVAWVATGVPLRSEEVYPRPIKFRDLANKDDLVSQGLGVRLDPDQFFRPNAGAHDFQGAYVHLIEPTDLW